MTTRFLLAYLILVVSTSRGLAQDQSWVGSDEGDPPLTRESANRIELVLRERTTCDFNNNPLEDVIRYLEMTHQIPIWFDKQALQDEGVAMDQQVTLEKSNITLQTALALLLEPIGLTTVTEDGVLKVTTQAKADEKMATRIYPVADLVNTPSAEHSYMTLIFLLQNQTSGKWMEIDAEGGAINPFPNAQALVIRQTIPVHRKIEGLLAALRKVKRLQHLSSIPASSDDPESLDPIEPTRTISRRNLRIPRTTQSWQRPRIHAND